VRTALAFCVDVSSFSSSSEESEGGAISSSVVTSFLGRFGELVWAGTIGAFLLAGGAGLVGCFWGWEWLVFVKE